MMKHNGILLTGKKLILLLTICTVMLQAQTVKIASGAGYKKPLMDIIKESNLNIEPFFGNMRQVSTQAKQTDITMIIGDKNFLTQKSGLEYQSFTTLGKGKVVLAYKKGLTLNNIEDINSSKVSKISIPQPKKAIYGIAGFEFLQNTNLFPKIEDKLHIVATVPQAMTYVITGEVDVAIVNLTAALANQDKIGGFIEIDPTTYTPIDIVAGVLPACNNDECKNFLEHLSTQKAQEIFKRYGL